jgi:hypothetical protein
MDANHCGLRVRLQAIFRIIVGEFLYQYRIANKDVLFPAPLFRYQERVISGPH